MNKNDVVIITEHMPPGWEWDPKSPVRGTDKFYVETAVAAVEMGRTVAVVYDGPALTHRGVSFHPRGVLPLMTRRATVIVCNPRTPIINTLPRDVIALLWTNFFMPRSEFEAWFKMVKGVDFCGCVCISYFHLSKMPAEVAQYFRVVQHGVDHFKYWGGNMTQNRARRVVYSSSPDRGLDRLKKIQPQIEALGYELYITPYGGTSSLTDEALSKVLQTSQFWVHPGGGVELFCIAAVEAQVAGCTPIVVPNGGLHETVKHGYRFTDASFEEGLLAVLAGEAFMQGVNANHIPSWSLATKSLLNVGEL